MANSGVARLGHTGAHALVTRGCAQQCRCVFELLALIVLSIGSWALNGLQIEQRSIAMFIHRITSRIDSPYVCKFAVY